MFDKRLFRELKLIKLYFVKVTVANIAAVTLTIFQALFLAKVIDGIFLSKKAIKTDLTFLILVITIKALLGWGLEYYNRRSAIKIKEDIRNRLLEGFIHKGPTALKDEKAGKIITLIQEGVEGTEAYFSEFIPQLFLVSVVIPMILLLVFLKDWSTGLIMLFTAPLIPLFMILIGKLADGANKKQWKTLQIMGGHFLDVLRGLPTLKLFGKSKKQGSIIKEISENYRESTMEVLKVSFLSALVLELIATISTALISVSLGIRLLYGKLDFKTAFLVLLLTPEFYQPMRQLGAKFHSAMTSIAVADDIYSRLEDKYESKDKILDHNSFNILINNLTFSYNKEVQVLIDLSMEIPQGKRISIVGKSGSGKSTILALIMGFLEGYSGSIKVNGVELSQLSKENWFENFSYVPQNPKIFKATVLENISMANKTATFEEVVKISKLTGIDDFINKLPEGYHTRIGEGGVNISGGQGQLISITRACLKDVNLIFLDEPTSALDSETESKINQAIEVLVKGKTVVTIAHRIPTIINSDEIYYLEEGKICEHGNHKELVKSRGKYYELLQVWEENL